MKRRKDRTSRLPTAAAALLLASTLSLLPGAPGNAQDDTSAQPANADGGPTYSLPPEGNPLQGLFTPQPQYPTPQSHANPDPYIPKGNEDNPVKALFNAQPQYMTPERQPNPTPGAPSGPNHLQGLFTPEKKYATPDTKQNPQAQPKYMIPGLGTAQGPWRPGQPTDGGAAMRAELAAKKAAEAKAKESSEKSSKDSKDSKDGKETKDKDKGKDTKAGADKEKDSDKKSGDKEKAGLGKDGSKDESDKDKAKIDKASGEDTDKDKDKIDKASGEDTDKDKDKDTADEDKDKDKDTTGDEEDMDGSHKKKAAKDEEPKAPPMPYNPLREAIFLMNNGQAKQALARLNDTLKSSPFSPQAHYVKAVALVHLRQFQEAANEYREVLRLVPSSPLSNLAAEGLRKIGGAFPDVPKLPVLER